MVSTIKVPVESFYATYITLVIIEVSLFIVYSFIHSFIHPFIANRLSESVGSSQLFDLMASLL